MKWQFAVLEIYQQVDFSPEGHLLNTYPWPTSGAPAEWIEGGLVSYCDGDVQDLVARIPLWWIIWWRIKSWMSC